MKQEYKGISNGVMLNAYPDSIGSRLSDTIVMLKKPELQDVFSFFYVLPTFFNSDLDRGFSIIDYNLNNELVSDEDLKALHELNIRLKFDIVLNHLSVASPQFNDLLKNGTESKYKDFFINWNTFWEGHGKMNEQGVVIPKDEHLQKLFMRKAGLPILKVRFPDGTEQPYWNTFYQKIEYNHIDPIDLFNIKGLNHANAESICSEINLAIGNGVELSSLDFNELIEFKKEVIDIVESKRSYLGQMDVNAKSSLVWDFYNETLCKLKGFGCEILRLDAFAYLHKEIGQSNFFNTPGTWEYLDRINQIAKKNNLKLLPEIHAEYGLHLHDQIAEEGYQIYDFFLPGLVIHTLETQNSSALINWAKEIIKNNFTCVNMLGCHDGIPVLDLKGKEVGGNYNEGLLADIEIDSLMNLIIQRGGRVKNLYDAEGKKLSYYQVNATFFSAIGEDEQKLLLARAIQMFMPGIPQVWYLDLFAGKNDYEAADRAGSGGHKEINRTNLSNEEIEAGLKRNVVINQLNMMRIRNTNKAFTGSLIIKEENKDCINLKWEKESDFAHLKVNLRALSFSIRHKFDGNIEELIF